MSAARLGVAPLRAAALDASHASVRALVEALLPIAHASARGARLAVLTGAGVSTNSGIPDYRSPGRPPHKPIQNAQFLSLASTRQRYWSRSFVGYPVLSQAQPNGAHEAVAELQRLGLAHTVVTQNVDGLHAAAGSGSPHGAVIELHGNIHGVECLDCGATEARTAYQSRLQRLNPAVSDWLHGIAAGGGHSGVTAAEAHTLGADTEAVTAAPGGEVGTYRDNHGHGDGGREGPPQMRPDGDMALPDGLAEAFEVPPCHLCGGTVKPGVVFFGGNVPRHVSEAASRAVDEADGLLVLGSTLQVWSSYRLARAAAADGKPVLIVNRGDTRADPLAHLKVEEDVAAVMPPVVARLAEVLREGEERGGGGGDWRAALSMQDRRRAMGSDDAHGAGRGSRSSASARSAGERVKAWG